MFQQKQDRSDLCLRDIVTGKGNEDNIGGNSYAEIIRKQRLDTTVKAIVLRVNSPGGSAVASDIMWKELELSAKVKPVVISMGNYAASGGYFISAPATKIYASPTTIIRIYRRLRTIAECRRTS